MAPSPADRAAARRELTLREAREDFLAFARYAFGWLPAPHHREWTAAVAEHPRVVVVCPPEFGKTSLLTIAWLVWRLGRDPNECVAIVSETETQASRPLAAIREAITSNPRVREVFPNLRPAGGAREKWSDTEVLVERSKALKDPSIQAVGIGGPLLGSRLTLAVLDDCVSWESAWTPGQRAKAVTWYRSTLVGRILAGGQIVVVGNPWHSDDLLGELQRSSEYRALRTPALAAEAIRR